MAALPPAPPRVVGDPAQDIIALANWASDFYKATVLENAFLQTGQQLDNTNNFDPASLPDPASTTIAQAQDTANNAYILANSAKTEADTNKTDITTLGTKVGPCGSITISDAATTGAFTFPTAQTNTSYFVEATCTATAGGPPLESTFVVSVSKATDKVTITINTAPGTGKSSTFDITIRRN